MDTEEFDRILRHTLADFRLSRGEKRVLGKVFDEIGADEHRVAVLRQRLFAIAREAINDPQSNDVIEWLEDVVKTLHAPRGTDSAPPALEAHFSPGEECRRQIIRLLEGCRSSIDICVFTITDNHISSAILDAHGRNIQIRVITDNEKALDSGSDVHRLERRGITVRVDQSSYHMHHKFAVFDQTCVLTGSYNWTRSAALYNEENLIVSKDPRLAKAFAGQFEQLWKNLA